MHAYSYDVATIVHWLAIPYVLVLEPDMIQSKTIVSRWFCPFPL